MNSLRILSPLINFSVIAYIGLKTLNTSRFNPGDISLSLIALIFSLIVEIKIVINQR